MPSSLIPVTTVNLAIGEAFILCCTPPLPLVGVSIWMKRGCQQNNSLADGYTTARVHVNGRDAQSGQSRQYSRQAAGCEPVDLFLAKCLLSTNAK